ncbi:MAG: peptide ABC transporter substrate-binding protein [Planctomycetaceae bacterium]|nr:peptide ABC transporter substrate-binding protein [Planctomycetales bacterium]MCB9926281.1 peptide ABC transporter substrate-binding protein [Planctomycetaceae bacterium]
MPHTVRSLFPYIAIVTVFSALVWAVSFGTLPPADFSFHNGDEVKTVDPAIAYGQPEHRVLTALFEGLYRDWPIGLEVDEQGNFVQEPVPDSNGNYPVGVVPAVAESYELSEDGRVYTFHIRRGLTWSDGKPLNAHDFVWSWRRTLHPETGATYAYQLWYLTGAKQYTEGRVELGDLVEIEMTNRKQVDQPFPRGDIRRARLVGIARPPKPSLAANAADDERSNIESEWRSSWVYIVDQAGLDSSGSSTSPQFAAYSKQPAEGDWRLYDSEWLGGEPPNPLPEEQRRCQQILVDFESTVGVQATDDHTLVVTLENRTPFFLHLTSFYALYPVSRSCVEEHGTPDWTEPEKMVTNGAYTLEFRRVRDRLRLVKNPKYWDASRVRLDTVDALAVKSLTTALNMYLTGQIQWATDVPAIVIPDLMKRPEGDFKPTPILIIYFYRLNTTRPPLDDVHVRRALNLAMDKQLIVDKVTQAGQIPARSIVPPGLPGYTSPLCGAFDVKAAREELKKSKYAKLPGGVPKIEITYNTHDTHRAVAEVIQQQWKNNLGIDVELRNMEWNSYLAAQRTMEYSVCRAGWVPDYPDANTFIDMWVTGGENNETGWSNADYDRLVRMAAEEPDNEIRLRRLEEAEAILMDEMPIVPIYYYTGKNLVSPKVKGFFHNTLEKFPIQLMRIEDSP